MNNGMQGGDSEKVRKYYRNVIEYLPAKSLTCLDLGSGVNFVFEKMLQKIRGGVYS